MSKTQLTDIQQMYSDGYPSIANKPKVTLSPNSCEKHGRIHFQSGKKNFWPCRNSSVAFFVALIITMLTELRKCSVPWTMPSPYSFACSWVIFISKNQSHSNLLIRMGRVGRLEQVLGNLSDWNSNAWTQLLRYGVRRCQFRAQGMWTGSMHRLGLGL